MTVEHLRVVVTGRHAAHSSDEIQVPPAAVVEQVLHARLVHQERALVVRGDRGREVRRPDTLHLLIAGTLI